MHCVARDRRKPYRLLNSHRKCVVVARQRSLSRRNDIAFSNGETRVEFTLMYRHRVLFRSDKVIRAGNASGATLMQNKKQLEVAKATAC